MFVRHPKYTWQTTVPTRMITREKTCTNATTSMVPVLREWNVKTVENAHEPPKISKENT